MQRVYESRTIQSDSSTSFFPSGMERKQKLLMRFEALDRLDVFPPAALSQ